MNLNLINESTRRKIVDDLLLRKPKGEAGVKPVYETEEYYCYEASKYKKRVKCNHSGWGYTDESIWDLGFRCESDVRNYVFRKLFN